MKDRAPSKHNGGNTTPKDKQILNNWLRITTDVSLRKIVIALGAIKVVGVLRLTDPLLNDRALVSSALGISKLTDPLLNDCALASNEEVTS